jgi:hypothetical protein
MMHKQRLMAILPIGSLATLLAGVVAIVAAGLATALPAKGDAAIDPAVVERFQHLSTGGNSNCSQAFLNSIAGMPPAKRLQGSCCSPMSLHRYSEQLAGLKKYADVAAIPADPYDIEAGLAQAAMAAYELELTADEQQAYDYAMENSEEGPCCCQCWRWYTYGGLAKLLIRNHGFSGAQVAEVWNLLEGCGGDEHEHS